MSNIHLLIKATYPETFPESFEDGLPTLEINMNSTNIVELRSCLHKHYLSCLNDRSISQLNGTKGEKNKMPKQWRNIPKETDNYLIYHKYHKNSLQIVNYHIHTLEEFLALFFANERLKAAGRPAHVWKNDPATPLLTQTLPHHIIVLLKKRGREIPKNFP